MKIGIPKEIKSQENRVAITPSGVRELVKFKHEVYVESNCGLGSGYEDAEYIKAGAKVLPNASDVWKSEMIIKVKEPLESEYKYFYPNQIIFTYFHLASNKKLTEELLKSKVIAIAYETIRGKDGSIPLLRPMSEVAGRLAIINGMWYMFKTNNGTGLLMNGTPGTEKANVTIIGGGVAGKAAANMAANLDCNVTVIEYDENKIRDLFDLFGNKVNLLKSNEANIEKAVINSDLVVSTVLIPGALAPKLVTEKMVKQMKKNSIIIDVAIDQGGSVETIDHATTHDNPIFKVHDVIHYSVANMPGAVPKTSTNALTNATIDYAVKIANGNLKELIKKDPGFKLGLQTIDGKLVFSAVADAHKLPYTNIDEL
ncbi:alanine dehydrogenase [Williamsoniiplasma lucivorax]|uniref:Alanine dehydrogenase n=1 Tax=Williamsoniiplasma lucivorax TaxID=209274 RepID=A0A2S5RFI3_9MOLU|nr:alanine dehydrogenase [Williamsoniiplasma lucivorax]PPE05895.1 alanine dehydrogenase [Williamsoniiplasma lucivorax]